MHTQTFERPAARTMSDALAALRQNEQVNPIVAAAPVGNEQQKIKVGQRVKVTYSNVEYNIGREGVVKEIHPHCGAVRVELDKAWMHDWVNPWDLEVLEEVPVEASAAQKRLPLATPVRFQRRYETVVAVVSGHNPNDRNRVRVSWFDDRLREVKHRWADADALVVLESKAASR